MRGRPMPGESQGVLQNVTEACGEFGNHLTDD